MKITIITAVWNREKTIGEAIASVQAQSFTDVEHLIVDGASQDATLTEIERRKDNRTRVISEPDRGIYDALNKGILQSTGDVIGLMHSDDFFTNEYVLARVAECFDTTQATAVYGDLDYVAAENTDHVIRHWKSSSFSSEKLRCGWMPPHPTLFLRRSVFEKYGIYDTSYRISADYDAILRYFSKSDIKPAYIPEVLVKMRIGGVSNRNLRQVIQKSLEDYRAIKANKIGGIPTLIAKNLSKISQFITR